jgi:toxin ParE1/3/4
MARYQIHPQALLDLDNIWSFIARDNFDAAERVVGEIRAALAGLADLPYQGHRRSDLTLQPFRFIRVYDYLIAYAPEESPVLVLAVMHGRRSPRVLAAILKGRQ